MVSIAGKGAVAGSGNLSTNNAGGRDFIDDGFPVTADASLTSVDFVAGAELSTANGRSIKAKVWRPDNTTTPTQYTYIGESQAVTDLASGQVHTLTLDTPIAVLTGDRIGLHGTQTSASVMKADASTGDTVYFEAGDNTGVLTIASINDLADFAMSLEAFGTVSGGDTITITEKTDGEIVQRTAATNNAAVTISGTYSGTPTAIEYRLLLASDDTTEVQTWATLDAAPTGGTFSGTPTITSTANYVHAEVRYSNDTGVTSLQANDWGVGTLVGTIGQSNIENWFTDGTGTPNGKCSVHAPGGWVKQSTTGTGAIGFGNKLSNALGHVVGLLDYSVGGSGLVSGVTSPYWGDSTGSYYTNFTAAVTAVGGGLEFILWAQGEQDAFVGSPTATEANYTSTLNSLVAQCRTDINNDSDQTNLPFIISQLGRATNGATDANTQAIKDALFTVATTTADCYLGATTHDIPLSDSVHFTTAGYTTHGERMAQAVLDITGDVTFHRGPAIASATLVDSTTIDVTLTHVGGTDFTPTTSITGFEVFDDATPVTISTAVRQSATVIRLGLAAAITGTATARYMYGVNPTITGVVLDNSTESLPLEMDGDFAVAPANVVTGSGSHQALSALQSGSGAVVTTITGTGSHQAQTSTGTGTDGGGMVVVGSGSHQAYQIQRAQRVVRSLGLIPAGQ